MLLEGRHVKLPYVGSTTLFQRTESFLSLFLDGGTYTECPRLPSWLRRMYSVNREISV